MSQLSSECNNGADSALLIVVDIIIPELERSYEERVRCVESIVEKHKQPTNFESFSAQVFSPASLPGMCITYTGGGGR